MNSPDIIFIWDIHYLCNYNCPYCWYYVFREKLSKFNRDFSSIEELENIWDNIYEKYGSVKIEIIGGEPLTYPNIIGLIEVLSRKHYIKVISNLSIPSIVSNFAAKLNPERVELNMNFHPQFAELDRFIRRALLMKMKGFSETVCVCAYPLFSEHLSYYKKRFEDRGLSFALLPFIGTYEGKTYPESYTRQEKDMILQGSFNQDKIRYFLNKTVVKGKLCSAGLKYAVVRADGGVFRCRGYFEKEKLGNIFSGDLNLYSQVQPCVKDFCPTGECFLRGL